MLDKNKTIDIIIKKSKSGSTYKTFIFKCIECDNFIKAQSTQLKTHSGKCKSCTQKNKPYEHILNELIYSCKNKQFINLNYDDFINIIKNNHCHYCNRELIFNKYTRNENLEYVSRAYQLDRKNNLEGYTVENVVPCCWNCNRMKSNIYTYEEFIKFIPILKELHNLKIKKNKK